jgi:hypothetical protein
MQVRSTLSSIALVGSIILCAGCGDERVQEAQTAAGSSASASAVSSTVSAKASAGVADPTAGLTEVKQVELRGWVSEAPEYTNAVSLQQGSEGQPAPLKITFSGGEKDKTAIKKAISNLSVAAGSVLVLQVINANPYALPVSVALKTGKTWTYHESERVTVAANGTAAQRIVIDLSKATFKSESTQWKNTGAISDLDQLKELQICVYNQKQSGELTVTSVDIRSKP